MASDADNVRVAVRIRPLVKSETDRGCQNVIDKVPDEPQIQVKNSEAFTFNYVFTPDISQEYIYETAVKNVIDKLFKGYNVTILAYGQTGSGKTYTMGTAFSGQLDAHMGVIPRAMYEIFNKIDGMTDHTFKVTCSFMELYQEQLYDLLSNNTRENSVVDIREDGNKGIIIPGLTETPVETAIETTECLIKGSAGRAVGATAMNAQSSRSHAIFTVSVLMTKKNDSNAATSSKFHLVDLAGSERSKKTKATGDRFKEGVKINQGLLALGNVISALGTGQTGGYVGYRDSKLTRLLQDSLGGNSVTLMIACVSPADYNVDETLSTLRYADRARKIKNKPIVNQDPKAAEINRLNKIIQQLRLELLSKGGTNGSILNGSIQQSGDIQKTIEVLTTKTHSLQQQLQAALHDVAEIEMRAVVAESAQDEIHQKIIEVKALILELQQGLTDDSSAEHLSKYLEMVEGIRKIIEEISDNLVKNKEELLVHKQSFSSDSNNPGLTGRQSLDEIEALQQKIDTYTSKQVSYNNELRKMNRELILKEELHQKVLDNMSKFSTYEKDNGEDKMQEYETLIKVLEEEKSDLLQKLKCVKDNISQKLAEERRKRVQQLEQQINDLRRKNVQQAKLLKMREKESEKVKNLGNEIREMKAAKVKLIRAMRAESENFRQWKLAREKEVTQLKEKDRKMQNEMVRKEALHCKQKNVLKRKVEEAMANNKRLKDALEKQRSAQASRKQNNTGKVDHVISAIDHELEIILSVIDAKFSLEQLMEDRALLATRLNDVKSGDLNDSKDISALENEIQMRNAQISDIQQKVLASDTDTKVKEICEEIHSVAEGKAAVKHVVALLVDMKKEMNVASNKLDDLRSSVEVSDEKILQLENQIEVLQAQHLEEKSEIENRYEEKITILLRELNKVPPPSNEEISPESSERMRILQEALDQLDTLREEVETYKNEIQDLRKQLQAQQFKKPRGKKETNKETEVVEVVDFSFNDTEDDFEDNDDDPDWVKTPRFRGRSTVNREERHSRNADITVQGVKRSSDGSFRCSCKGDCTKKLCTCRKNASACSENCKCTDMCANRAKNDDDSSVSSTSEIKNEIKEEDISTPKKIKLLSETFDADNTNKLDVTTPSYPYSMKKRKPFFE